jgi:hypothetical protein
MVNEAGRTAAVREIVILIVILASGCTNWRTLETPDPPEAVARIGVNDTVNSVTHDGNQYEIRVAAVKEDALIGTDNEQILIDAIHIIKVKHFDAADTGDRCQAPAPGASSAESLRAPSPALLLPGRCHVPCRR